MGPINVSVRGNRWIIVFTDCFTKYTVVRALPKAEAELVAQALEKSVIFMIGMPDELLSDNGKQFTSQLIEELSKRTQIQRFSTTYWPQGNLVVERVNRTLGDMLSKYTNKKMDDWDKYLAGVTYAYNTTIHHTTNETPFFMMFGRDPKTPGDWSLTVIPPKPFPLHLRRNEPHGLAKL